MSKISGRNDISFERVARLWISGYVINCSLPMLYCSGLGTQETMC